MQGGCTHSRAIVNVYKVGARWVHTFESSVLYLLGRCKAGAYIQKQYFVHSRSVQGGCMPLKAVFDASKVGAGWVYTFECNI